MFDKIYLKHYHSDAACLPWFLVVQSLGSKQIKWAKARLETNAEVFFAEWLLSNVVDAGSLNKFKKRLKKLMKNKPLGNCIEMVSASLSHRVTNAWRHPFFLYSELGAHFLPLLEKAFML